MVWASSSSFGTRRGLRLPVSEEDIGHTFTPEGHATLLPYGPALVEVAQAHFAFSTADEGLPDGVPECPPAATEMSEQRLQRFSEACSS